MVGMDAPLDRSSEERCATCSLQPSRRLSCLLSPPAAREGVSRRRGGGTRGHDNGFQPSLFGGRGEALSLGAWDSSRHPEASNAIALFVCVLFLSLSEYEERYRETQDQKG